MTRTMTITVEASYSFPNIEGVGENARQAVEHALKIRGFQNITARLELQEAEDDKRGL